MITLLFLIWLTVFISVEICGLLLFHASKPEEWETKKHNDKVLAEKMLGRSLVIHAAWWPWLAVVHIASIARYKAPTDDAA